MNHSSITISKCLFFSSNIATTRYYIVLVFRSEQQITSAHASLAPELSMYPCLDAWETNGHVVRRESLVLYFVVEPNKSNVITYSYSIKRCWYFRFTAHRLWRIGCILFLCLLRHRWGRISSNVNHPQLELLDYPTRRSCELQTETVASHHTQEALDKLTKTRA